LRIRREVTVSGAESSTANLFLSDANLLLGEPSDATGDHDYRDVPARTCRRRHRNQTTGRGDAALNAQDRTHLHRAIINADRCMLLQPAAGRATHLAIDATEASAIFELIAERLKEPGIETPASI
jgi:hypothetical protein